MISLLLFAQIAVATDSTYSSNALRALVARAAVENRAPPPAFRGYTAHVETELSLILRDTLGRENAGQIEQLASSAKWTRGGDYDMHVVGYRSQGAGVPYSTLSFVRGWTEPSLYGDRLRLGAQMGNAAAPPADTVRRDTIFAVHPLARDRDRFYRFTGGDTIGVFRTRERTITIVRIHATPHLSDSSRLAAFDGEIQIDAERAQIVRMRGRFVALQPNRSRPLMARIPGVVAVAYSEFTNVEVNGKYWLPSTQRTEFQSQIALLGRTRAVMRIISEFSDYAIDDSSAGSAASLDGNRRARVTTWAPPDSVNAYGEWRTALGVATASVSAGDFDDIGPDIWRTTGGIFYDFTPTKPDNIVGFDRVQGLYTGAEGTVRMRSVFPGLSASARIGWAWTERTVRGGVTIDLQRGAWRYGARADRALVTTNDFLRPYEPSSGGLNALLASLDDFDYVDRSRVVASTTHILGTVKDSYITLEGGWGRDGSELARLTRGLRGDAVFRPNRAATNGGYGIVATNIELHSRVTGEFVDPGIGGRLHSEVAAGTLQWHRTELSLSARQYQGPFTVALHADAGIVTGSTIPQQTLFELGGQGSLPGYAYKEFGGDRAALFRGFTGYAFPVWRTPQRIWRGLVVPGLSPGLAVSVSGGWTQISSSAARAAFLQLGVPARASERVRATAGAGLTLFGGNAHIGFARPLKKGASWKFAAGLGQDF